MVGCGLSRVHRLGGHITLPEHLYLSLAVGVGSKGAREKPMQPCRLPRAHLAKSETVSASLSARRIVVVVSPDDGMCVDVYVAAPTNAHGVDARRFPEHVVVASMVAFKVVLPFTGRTEILAYVIGQRLRRL